MEGTWHWKTEASCSGSALTCRVTLAESFPGWTDKRERIREEEAVSKHLETCQSQDNAGNSPQVKTSGARQMVGGNQESWGQIGRNAPSSG